MNAVDAIVQRGSIAISVESMDIDERPASVANVQPGTFVAIVVRDTGTGMSADVLTHIFEPFFTTKPPEHGTGLGLATVFGIVRQAGGTVDVESAPQHGTTFRVLLPAARPDQDG